MKKSCRSLAPMQFSQNLFIYQESFSVKDLSTARLMSLTDYVHTNKQKVVMPKNTSIKEIQTFKLDELVDTDDVDFAVNLKDDFIQKMKFPQRQLKDLKTRLKNLEISVTRNLSHIQELSVNQLEQQNQLKQYQ